jgi:serine/threonine protein kinase
LFFSQIEFCDNLEGVDHPGILRALDFRETELGPALVFEHDPSALRLDRFLAGRLNGLSLDERLALLRQLAEAIIYAHRKRLHHHGLAPQNILVREVEGDHPRLLVTNWLVASRGEGSATSYPMTAGTQHIEDYFPNPAKVYLAPEALSGEDDAAGIQADVFSLGAIAYHLFAGRPPADNRIDLPNRLRAGNGLRLSDAVDGVGEWLGAVDDGAASGLFSRRRFVLVTTMWISRPRRLEQTPRRSMTVVSAPYSLEHGHRRSEQCHRAPRGSIN